MSEDPSFDYDPEDFNEDSQEGPDPRTVAFLDQESEQFNESGEKFAETFGFEHYCTCAQDYTEGRLVETTHCFGRLCQDALEACKEMKEERDMLLDVLRAALDRHDRR